MDIYKAKIYHDIAVSSTAKPKLSSYLSEIKGDNSGTAPHPAQIECTRVGAHVELVTHHRAQRRRG